MVYYIVGGIIAVIIVLAIFALVAAVIITSVVITTRERRRKGINGNVTRLELDHISNAARQIASENIELNDNPVYQQIALENIKLEDNPVYKRVDESSAAFVSSVNMYDEPTENTYQFGVYVPTNAQREQIMDQEEERIYELLKDTQYLRSGKTSFFTEERIYWYPENNTKGIYEQLAKKKYREIPRHDIKVLDHLGSGQFGTVDKGVWNTPKGQVEVAIKTLKGASEEDELKFLQEAAINGQFRHPNVVLLCGVVTVGKPTMIVSECISNGDLKSYLESIRPLPGQLPDSSLPTLLMNFSRQVSCGMVYLSSKRFVHRDLAARNILVANETVCKIADFGMSRNLQDEAYYTSKNKTIPVKWTAPEAIHYSKYSTQSDVWSFGVVLYEIWSIGNEPFQTNTNHECIKLVESGYRLPSPPGCPRSVYQIMIDCWHPVAADRPTFESISSQLSQPPTTQPDDDTLSSLGTTVYVENGCYPELQNKYL